MSLNWNSSSKIPPDVDVFGTFCRGPETAGNRKQPEKAPLPTLLDPSAWEGIVGNVREMEVVLKKATAVGKGGE